MNNKFNNGKAIYTQGYLMTIDVSPRAAFFKNSSISAYSLVWKILTQEDITKLESINLKQAEK